MHISAASFILTFVIMSVQALLPRDTTIRGLSICVANDIVEKYPSYVSKPGPVKDRNAHTFTHGSIGNDVRPYVAAVTEQLVRGEKAKSYNRTILDANHQTWKLLKLLFSERIMGKDFYHDKTMANDILESEDISIARIGSWVKDINKQEIRDDYTEPIKTFHKLSSLAKHIEETRDNFNHAMKMAVKEWTRDGKPDGFVTPDPFSKFKNIRVYQIGTMVLVRVIKKDDEYEVFFFSNTHMSRVIEYIKSAATLALFAVDIDGMETDAKTLLSVVNKQIEIGLITPNGVGSVYKSARQVLFLRGDQSRSLGKKPVDMYVNGLDGVKERYAETIADFLLGITENRKSALNLANMFKMVPHPDQDMVDVFETIDGFKDSNPVDDTKMDRFEGMAMKAIYESLSQQKIDVRVTPKDPADDIASDFCKVVNSTSTPVSAILSAGYTKWASVKFQTVKGIFDKDKQDIPVSNKASAPDARLSTKEIENIPFMDTVSDYRRVRKQLHAVNDVVTTIAGTSDLGFKEGRAKFCSVIKAHEEFEATYLAKGKTIDDISSEDLANFVISDPDNAYTVLTEPKLNELHKELTRMFYMAQQALKIMTQVCERFTKKVISKASGVSIVKDYRSRRKELEAMLHSYTGVVVGEGDNVVFISFDMTEFSKKFSQKIIRKIGEILSALSGEDWMARIDVFFRAAVVYHNTRGFIGVKAGVRGGFEGFLNFIWTLAMRVVMDIATQSTGVTGVLAVYSDDGLLRLYIDGTVAEVKVKIDNIQRVFKSYGLIFHMDKTVASAELLEYLGVYGEKGMIIPNWIKEAMSIGKRKRGKGLETVYDRITLWDSQCSAVVKAGGPTYTPFLLKTILTVGTLRRLNLIIPSKILCAMTIIPYSAGGFRVAAISENSILSSIDGFSEFCSDIEIMSKHNPAIAGTILCRIIENLSHPKIAERSLLTGSLLQTELKDTSGMGIVKGLLESSTATGIAGVDPISEKVVKSILNELRRATNIPVKVIKNLIQTIPDVIEYNKSIALMKSDAALKFVEGSKIARAQRSDTEKCKESLTEWAEAFKLDDGYTSNVISTDIATHIIKKLYPQYSLARLVDSPRTALIPVRDNGDIITIIEYGSNDKLLFQDYKEPAARFLGAQLTPEASAEYTSNTKQRRNDRFIASAARLVASNRSLLSIYYIVANSFNLPCPSLPSASVVSAHRSSRNFGSNAVNVFLRAPFHAIISSRMSNKMWNDLKNMERSDKTTLVESARVATYLNLIGKIRTGVKQKSGIKSISYNVRDLVSNTSNPVFDAFVAPRRELVETEATKSFTTVMVEENAQANMLESSIMTQGLIETIKDEPIVKGILTSRFEKWLYSCVMGTFTDNKVPPNIPTPWIVSVYTESCISVSFKLCTPGTRRTLQTNCANLIRRTQGMSLREIMNDAGAMNELQNALNSRGFVFTEMSQNLSDVSACINALDLDARIRESIGEYALSNLIFAEALITFLKRRSVTGDARVPTVVINTDSFADSKLSKDVKTAIKNAVDNMISDYMNRATVTIDVEETEVHDHTINFLNVLKNMIRPSGHRNTPFNQHMVAIQVIKFELFIRECIEAGMEDVTSVELSNYRIPYPVYLRICKLNAVIGGKSGRTTGEDMRECLRNEGVLSSMTARASFILRRLRGTYNSGSITVENIMRSNTFMLDLLNYVLSTYNGVVKDAVQNLEIRHHREAETIGRATTLTPVEECAIISAEIVEGDLVAYEMHVLAYLDSPTYRDIIGNLLLAHYSRWGTNGYYSVPKINDILRSLGIFNGGADTDTLGIRDHNESGLTSVMHTDNYTLSISRYENEDLVIHNYLYVNRLGGGMAIMGKENDIYYLIAVIPKGVPTINTMSMHLPRYIEGATDKPPVYELVRAAVSLTVISRVVGARPHLMLVPGEIGSIVVQQAYQRIVGARQNIEDSDTFLMAMAEVVRGSWSVSMGLRVLSMFVAWYSTAGDVSKNLYALTNVRVNQYVNTGDDAQRMAALTSASALWSWFSMSNIVPGHRIDTSQVLRIVQLVGRNAVRGGAPSAFFSFSPRSVEYIRETRGISSVPDIIMNITPLIFAPPPAVDELSVISYESDMEDGDW